MTTAPVNGFDQQTAVDESDRHRYFAANVQKILREDYRLRRDEADLAFGRYLRRQTRWVTPDEAAYDAYRWWTPTVEATVVPAREAEQRTHARGADDQDPDRTDPGPVDFTLTGDDADRPRTDTVESDLAAAEAALSLIRGQGQRHGFTGDHVELIDQLKQLLDESPVWDTITPDTAVQENRAQTPSLEPALQPDRVWSGDDWDDMIVLDAAFAGTVITVLRPSGQVGPFGYVFLSDTPNHRGAKEVADIAKIGMIAAGDRTPEPGRATEYDSLGKQVRNHLIGLVDAVADAREFRSGQEGRRLHAAQAGLGSPVEASYQRPQPTRGTGR